MVGVIDTRLVLSFGVVFLLCVSILSLHAETKSNSDLSVEPLTAN